MSEEWGPWIEHDGKGCPCVGHYVHCMFDERVSGEPDVFLGEVYYIAGSRGIECRSWDWSNSREFSRVIRYRIRKPRGLTILENLVATLDAPEGPIRAPVQPKVDA
jgi:hypothetical protein